MEKSKVSIKCLRCWYSWLPASGFPRILCVLACRLTLTYGLDAPFSFAFLDTPVIFEASEAFFSDRVLAGFLALTARLW